ncbi:MAG: penicillin-binding protein activator [Pseudomonadota bacterium]
MSTGMSSARRKILKLVAGIAALALAACDVPSGGPSEPPIDTTDPVPVALLVPSGSGEAGDEVLARSLENAARLAIADLGGVQIDLRVYSTAGDPGRAQEAAVAAVDDGARIILGPVFAQAANAAGAAVSGQGVNVLSFSNNTDIAGGNVFVLGSTFQNTANRLVSYANGQGRGNIAVAYASDTVGQVGARSVTNAISQFGATLATQTTYPLSQEDVIAAVPGIASNVEASGATSLFLTAGPFGELPLIAELLPDQGFDTEAVKLIGLTRWDVPSSTLALNGLQGGWFALPDPALQAGFNARYQAAFGSSPHPIAGLAYDGIAAIGALVANGQSNALTADALTQPQGFAGVGGVFRLLPNRTNERALAIAEIQNNQAVIIDPAPRSFTAGGF